MNRGQLAYVIRFIITAWLGVAGLAGIVIGVFYLCQKNVTTTIIGSQVLL